MNLKVKSPVILILAVAFVFVGLFSLSIDLVGAADTVVPATIKTPPVEVRSGPNLAYHVLYTVEEEIDVSIIAKTKNGGWFYIRFDGMQGWVPKGEIRREGNIGSLPVWYQPMAGAKIEAVGEVVKETSIHSGQSVGYSRIATLTPGETVKAIARTNNRKWVYVMSDKGQGWVLTNHLDLKGALVLLPMWQRPTSSAEYVPLAETKEAVSLHSGPDRGYHKVGSLGSGIEVVIISRTNNRRWMFVESSAGNGWVETKYLDISSGVNPLPVWNFPMSNARFEPEAVVISAETILVLAGPREGYNIIGELVPGAEGVLLARNGNWRYIKTPYISGWVSQANLDIDGTQGKLPVWREPTVGADYSPEAVIAGEDVFALSGPLTGFSETIYLPVGTTVNIMARNRNSRWYFVRGNGGQGWVPANAMVGQIARNLLPVWNAPMPNALYEPTVIVLEETHALSAPLEGFSETIHLPAGTKINVIALSRNSQWYFIRGNGGQGWVPRVLVDGEVARVLLPRWNAPMENARYEPLAIVKEDVNVYVGSRARANDIIGELKAGEQVKILAIANRNWFYVKGNSIEGWAKSESLEHKAILRLLPIWKNPIGSQ